MINELLGDVLRKAEDHCIINVHGIGFRVDMSRTSLAALPEDGQSVHLYTHLAVREDSWKLIGFIDEEERQGFMDLIAVGGMGIKTALSVLGALGVDGLESAVMEGEWQRIKEAPGVGAKLAQRIQLELTGKWESAPPRVARSVPSRSSPSLDEVGQGLMALGYSFDEAQAASRLAGSEGDLPSRIRAALQALDRH